MDETPQRNRIVTPISKFEDSPVFNYINSLSPIKPVKSIHISQSFNSLSFASPPSVFTSPHISSHKEAGSLRRHHFLDPSKPGFSSPNENENENEGNENVGILESGQLPDCSADLRENINTESSIRKVTDEPNSVRWLEAELPLALKYDSGSPDCDSMHCHGNRTGPVSKLGAPESVDHFLQEVSVERHHSFESEIHFQGISQIEHIEEGMTGSERDMLISDAGERLVFHSANDAEAFKGEDQKLVDPGANSLISVVLDPSQDDIDNLQKAQTVTLACSCEQHEVENHATQPGNIGELKETDETKGIISSALLNKQTVCNPNEKEDDVSGNFIPFGCKTDSEQQRGMRRRCLVFEKAAAQKKNLENDSSSSLISLPEWKIASDDKCLTSVESGSSPPCMLPGIGLHLNALATTSKDNRVVKCETIASGRQKPLDGSLIVNSMDRDIALSSTGIQITEEVSRASSFEVYTEFNQSSPKNKRRRLENARESDSCKRCNCKKSKCLKLYCECFAAGVYCVEPCSCQDCFNNPIHEDTVLATRRQIESRNPLAFAPKVIRSINSLPEIGEQSSTTPASARHKRGCNCKKSSCLKKYCECFQGGVGCSINCRCEGCRNAFGQKDGSGLIEAKEVESGEEETEACERSAVDRSFQTDQVHEGEGQYRDHILNITPLQICSSLVKEPLPSGDNLPRSSLLAIRSSPHLSAVRKSNKSDILYPQPNFEKHFKMIPEDKTPEILKGSCSSITGVKSTSPNSKRVSLPHGKHGLSPGRKLILQSIPSFPSLTPHHESSGFPRKFE